MPFPECQANDKLAAVAVPYIDPYGDFSIGDGDGPKMNVPHKIREQLRTAHCAGSVDTKRVMNIMGYGLLHSESILKDIQNKVRKGDADPDLICANSLYKATLYASDSIREKFQVNQPLPSVEEEARLIFEQFGCLNQETEDPTSPCYDSN